MMLVRGVGGENAQNTHSAWRNQAPFPQLWAADSGAAEAISVVYKLVWVRSCSKALIGVRGEAIEEGCWDRWKGQFFAVRALKRSGPKNRVWGALCECEEDIAIHIISRTKSCAGYLLARPAPGAFAPSWICLSSQTSNLCPLINPLFLLCSWFRTPTLWLFLELWEVRSHLCLQRGRQPSKAEGEC